MLLRADPVHRRGEVDPIDVASTVNSSTARWLWADGFCFLAAAPVPDTTIDRVFVGNVTAPQRGRRRAEKAGLVYINDFDDGLTRRRCGRGFTYHDDDGRMVRDEKIKRRIKSLVIPPAWNDVWICKTSLGHIQARGKDDDGRTQYRYHDAWHAISTAAKFDRMLLVAELLPRIRRRVRKDLTGRELHRGRVTAAVVRMLDKAHLRIGNRRYFRQRGSHGATTLKPDHVDVERFRISLDFPGKSGKQRHVEFNDRKVARVISQCEEIDGQFLFCFVDDDGDHQAVHSHHVNDYLREVSGSVVTAKDFRTWSGSVIALSELIDLPPDASKRERRSASVAAVKATASELGNTTAVCRSSYIHPGILSAAESGELPNMIQSSQMTGSDDRSELTIAENDFANLLPYLEFT